jgi:hypothetical protein
MSTCEEDAAAVSANLLAALAGPAEMQGDAGRVKQHSIADLIAADRYMAAKCAVTSTSPRRGIRFTKLVPPGID